MKKHFISTSAQWLCALLCLFCLLGITSCATTRGAADTSSIVGTWAYDYGYNQELWADDLMTFNIDGTFDSHLVAPYYSEWDKGTWSLSTDAQGRQVLALHITAYSNDNSTWNNVDITPYYYIDVLDDELFMNRFKRDRVEEDGWHPVEYYEPAIYNHYYRVTDGNREQLIQDSWTVDKVRTQGCDWDETWTFNADGTMTSDWSDNGTEILTGTYDLKEKDGKTILHQKLSFENGITDEWWYEYSSCGPDLIRVVFFKSTIDGELDEPIVNYYYRDVPLVKYTYHWKTETQEYTFNDYWPKGREYTLLDSSKINYITNIPGQYLDQQILGCYDNETLSGSPLTSIRAADNTVDREFWINWAIKSHHNGGETEFCHSSAVPARDIFPDFSFKAGDTVTILFEADLSNDITGWSQIKFWNSQGMIGIGEREIHTQNRKLYAVYNVETSADSFDEVLDFEYVYNKESGPVVFSNWKLAILDDSNSYKVDYHFGDLTYTELAYTGSDRTLPSDMMYFEPYNWDIGHHLASDGWYTDASLSGNPVSSIAANSVKVGGTKDVYLKSIMKFDRWDGEGNDHGWGTGLPAKVLFSERDLQTILDSTGPVTFFLSAKSNEKLKIEGEHFSVELIDRSNNGWGRFTDKIFTYWQNEANEITALFTFEKDPAFKAHPSFDDLFTNFGYWYGSYDGEITFTDFKLILLDDKNSYNINYHIGELTYTEKAYLGADKSLPTDMMYFEQYNYDVAHNLQIVSWYDNDGLEGSAVSSITANSVSSGQSKDVYLKCNPIFKQDEAGGDGHTLIPALVFLSENALNAYAGKNTPITIRLTANVDPVPTATHPIFMEMANRSTTIGWEAVAWADGTFASVNNGILTVDFTFNCNEGMSYPSDISLMHFGIGYTSEFYDGDLTFTDFKLELVTD